MRGARLRNSVSSGSVGSSVQDIHNPELNALLQSSTALLDAGRVDQAIEAIEALLDRFHDCAEGHVLLGDALARKGSSDDARDSYILAACFKPDWSLPLVRRGYLAFVENRLDETIEALSEAIKRGSADALVYNTIGAAYYRKGSLQDAKGYFETALSLDATLGQAHCNLGYLLFHDLEQFEAGERHLREAMRLRPRDPVARCNWAMVLQHRGDLAKALALYDRLLSDDPRFDEARLNRGLIRLSLGDYANGWRYYEARKNVLSNYEARKLPWREWDGSPLDGKVIYVHTEQGLGDEIMFASCLPEIIAAARLCICECSPKLQSLFRRSFPGAHIVHKDAWRDPAFARRIQPDWQVALGTLPFFLRRSAAEFSNARAYLRADPERTAYWREQIERLPGKTKIGISWRGGAASTRRVLRSIELAQWRPILSIRDCAFVSLQYSDCEAELTQARQDGPDIAHWQEAIDDYDETAALVSALDLVISVQTAVVHLAGALGRRAWVLTPAVPEWRYCSPNETMPWYASVRVLKQTQVGDWSGVIARAAADLSA